MESKRSDEIIQKLGCTTDLPETQTIDKLVRQIVEEKTCEVSRVVNQIKSFLKDETTELSDLEIEDILLQLPILLYNYMEEQEIIGLRLDVAKQLQKEANSEALLRERAGTVQEKSSKADLATRAEQMETIIYERSYNIIRRRFDMAIETLNAVKKVHASRLQRYEMSSKSNKF